MIHKTHPGTGKTAGLLLLLFLFPVLVKAQEPSAQTLEDLTQRAMIQISLVQEYITMIAGAEEPLEVRKRGIKNATELFTDDGVVEEQGRSGKKRVWKATDYFNTLLSRGGKSPVIINFTLLTALNPENLIKVINDDGSVSYRGKVRFEQHYCKTNGEINTQETLSTPVCVYEDYTEKEVTVELKRTRSTKGVFWLMQISSIRVLKVR